MSGLNPYAPIPSQLQAGGAGAYPIGPGYVGSDIGRQYFNTDPSAYWGRTVDQLGGPNTALGRFAAQRLNDAWTGFTRASTSNPQLKFADYADQNYNAGNIQQQYALSSPFQRDPYNQPTWSQSRYLG